MCGVKRKKRKKKEGGGEVEERKGLQLKYQELLVEIILL